ncbi:unnamed protein product, partial [Clonostachys rhizophaga]
MKAIRSVFHTTVLNLLYRQLVLNEMPITEYKPSFLKEAWALHGIGTAVLLLRFAVRFKTIGISRLQFDDLFAFLALIFYACDAATVHLVYFLGTNVEASTIQTQRELCPEDVADFTLGSKLQLVAWYSYIALLWSLKGTMLCFFSWMTIGTLHSLLAKMISIAGALSYIAVSSRVVPDPGTKTSTAHTFRYHCHSSQCVNRRSDALHSATLTMEALIPLLATYIHECIIRKLAIGILLSSGIFVMAAALIRLGFSLSSNPSAANVNSWGVRETIVGIITVNIPILRPMFNRLFWKPGLSPPGSERRAKSGTGTGTGIKSTHISAQMPEAFEMATGKAGHMNNYTRYRSSTDGDSSEEGILRDPQPPSVL